MHAAFSRAGALVLCLALGLAAGAQNTVLPATVYPVPAGTHNGSGYTAIERGPDGKIYVGTAWYGGSAHLMRINPVTGGWEKVFDAHAVTRHTGTGLDAHGKFHAKILVGADGIVWAATKQGNEEFVNRPEYGESHSGYPGGHLFSYNPATGQVTDHGILLKQEGLMGGAIDNARKRIYYVTDPKGRFLVYDIAANSVRDLGAIGGAPRYMAIDAQGRVFCGSSSLPGDPGSNLAMYDPATDRLYQLRVNVVEGDAKDYTYPYVLIASADGRTLYGTGGRSKHVLEFDLSTVKLNARLPYAHGTIDCRLVGEVDPGHSKAGTLGQDNNFYFQRDNRLLRFDTKTRAVEQLGLIEVPGGDKRVSFQGACYGADGTLYLKLILPSYVVLAYDKLTAGGK